VPLEPFRTAPWLALPKTFGGSVLAGGVGVGGAAVTIAVALEAADFEPAAFFAVTVTRIADPTSAPVSA
jgi:hypothetical protein